MYSQDYTVALAEEAHTVILKQSLVITVVKPKCHGEGCQSPKYVWLCGAGEIDQGPSILCLSCLPLFSTHRVKATWRKGASNLLATLAHNLASVTLN